MVMQLTTANEEALFSFILTSQPPPLRLHRQVWGNGGAPPNPVPPPATNLGIPPMILGMASPTCTLLHLPIFALSFGHFCPFSKIPGDRRTTYCTWPPSAH